MPTVADRPEAPTAIQTNLAAIFVSLELSRSIWLITSLSPGSGEKMSKHSVRAGDVAALLARFSELKRKASERTGKSFPIVVIQEAGLDGFWLHRVLQSEGIESHVVDPASIATSRRRRRAKTDRIDGEALLRALLAFKRGEPRVCAMVKAPTPEEEDRRRLCRERKVLIAERVKHVNRVKGLLFSQGVSGYEPLRRDRRQRLDELTTGDGRSLPMHLKTQISRELDRLELLLDQIKRAEAERDALLAAQQAAAPGAGGEDVARVQGHRRGVRRQPLVGGAIPPLRQSPPTRVIRGAGADALAKRIGRSRAGRFQSRQSAIANHPDSACLAMAPPSAAIGAGSVVQRTGQPQRRPSEEDDHRGAGAQAAGGAVEICHRRRRHRRRRDEGRLSLTTDAQQIIKSSRT